MNETDRSIAVLFSEIAGLGTINSETPMNEARERARHAGVMIGRVMAVYEHEGDIGADIAMKIRASENVWIEAMTESVTRVLAPGGELREMFNSAE